MTIGKLQRVPLREVWQHEAYDFTRWLEDNLDILNSVLDLNLTAVEREQSAGNFSVDLVAEDERGKSIIIENQLEKSDHDHLGKLITYLSALDSETAIWIVADPRPEHTKAIAWLNETGVASFYLVKVEAVKIGDFPPAPLLTLIMGPSQESREVGQTKKDWVERDKLRYEFWSALLEKAKTKTKLHSNITPSQYHWIGASAGKRGLGFNYTMRQHDAVVELYIDRGKEGGDENQAIFEELYAAKDSIENAFGDALDWQRLDGKRACRIKAGITSGGFRDRENWDLIQDEMITAMIRLEKALKPYIQKLDF